VEQLRQVCDSNHVESCQGIAHTRWATHGVPSAANAHPHVSQGGDIALVHNGIIENYQNIRQQLAGKGYTFKSETDTEVLVQLIDYCYRSTNDLVEAVRLALNKVVGAYAIAVVDRRQPGRMVAARKSSPLVVGVGKDNSEYLIASDASPIVEHTSQMVYLDDGEIADITVGKDIVITTLESMPVEPHIKTVDLDISKLTRGGYEHFMLKEIHDQPQCLRDSMRGRLITQDGKGRVVLSAVQQHRERLLQARDIIIVACGTSWHAGLIGKQLIEQLCRKRVQVEYASEFRYRDPVIGPDDVVIAISQSGETADTLAAVQLARQHGAFIMGIVNTVGSSIARATDTGIYIHVGPEIGVASTKAFTGQVTVLTLLALALGHENGTLDEALYQDIIAELDTIPDKMSKVLQQDDKIARMALTFTYASNFIYLGRGYNYPVALEGALKLKEISYIHAEGYPAAEMKHGPIALVDENMPIVFVATHHQLHNKIISNMKEVKARNGRILAIITEGDNEVPAIADDVIEVPPTHYALAPLLSVIPLQLLAYHVAVAKHLNVDMPRNLAKSVTVE